MFKAAYQGDSSVEVFTARGSSDSQLGLNKWRLTGSTIRKEFSKKVRGPIIIAQGSTSASAMLLPKDTASHLGLLQPVVVLQICFMPPTVKSRCDFAICMNVRDTERQPHRLQFCSINVCRNDKNQTHDYRQFKAFVSEQLVPRGKWLNLFLDLESIMQQVYNSHLATVDSLQLCGTFKLRRIFTMSNAPESAIATFEDVPSRYHFHAGLDFRNILLQMQSNQIITKAIETGTDKQFLSVNGHNNNSSTSNLLTHSYAGGDALSSSKDDDDSATLIRYPKPDAATKIKSTEQQQKSVVVGSKRQKSAQSSSIRTTSSSTRFRQVTASTATTTTTTSSRAKGVVVSPRASGASAAMAVCQQQQKTLGNARRLENLLKSRDKIATHLAAAAITLPGADLIDDATLCAKIRTLNSATNKKVTPPRHSTSNSDEDGDDYGDEHSLILDDRPKSDHHFAAGDASFSKTVPQISQALLPSSTIVLSQSSAPTAVDAKPTSATALDELLKGDFLLSTEQQHSDDAALKKPSRPHSSFATAHANSLSPPKPIETDDDDSDFPVLKPKSPTTGLADQQSTTTTNPTSDSERDGNRTETMKRHSSLASIESSIANSNRTYTKLISAFATNNKTDANESRRAPGLTTTSEEDSAISSFGTSPLSSSATRVVPNNAREFSSTTTHRSRLSSIYKTPLFDYDDTASDSEDNNVFSFGAFDSSLGSRDKNSPSATSRNGSGRKSNAKINNNKKQTTSPSSRFATLDCTADSQTSLSSSAFSDDGISSNSRTHRHSNSSYDAISSDTATTGTTGGGGYESGSDGSGETIRAATQLLAATKAMKKLPKSSSNDCDIDVCGRRVVNSTVGSTWKLENNNISPPNLRPLARHKHVAGSSQLPASNPYTKNHSLTTANMNSSSSATRQKQHNLPNVRTATTKSNSLSFTSNNTSPRASPVDRSYTDKYNTDDNRKSPKLRLTSARSSINNNTNAKWL